MFGTEIIDFDACCRQNKKPITLAVLSVRVMKFRANVIMKNDLTAKHEEKITSCKTSKT